MKILLATQKPFAAAAVKGITDILEAAGHQVVKLEKYPEQADLVAAVADVEAMIIRSDKVTEEVMAAAPKLKIVVRAGAGFDNVDLAAATARGIVVMNTPGQNSNAVAELAIGLMIYAARTRNVGRLVGQKAKAMGMEICALDPFLTDEQIISGGAQPVHSVEELYAASDYLSIHIPALPSTIKSIGYDLITRMPKGATLVNTARKEVIDEEGLMKALEERPDLKYFADVMPDNYAALQEKFGLRVFATPKKMGAQTAEANVNAGLAAARQIADFFATGNTRFQVNK